MGDKNRGGFECIFENVQNLIKFDNGFMKVKNIRYNFKYFDDESRIIESNQHNLHLMSPY